MLYFHEKTADGFNARKVEEVLYHGKTKYQTIDIVRHANLGKTLYLDSCFQSDDSFQEEYHKSMVNLVSQYGLYKSILILGSGPGGLAKACLERFSQQSIVAIELDEEAYKIYNNYIPEWAGDSSKHIAQIFTDATTALTAMSSESYDIIFWDIDADAIQTSKDPKNIYGHLKRVLSVKGVFVATAGFIQERTKDDPYRQFIENIKEVFPEGQLAEMTRMNWNFFYATRKS